jgi:hypothetical protein
MGLISIALNILTLLILGWFLRIFINIYDSREVRTVSAVDVMKTLLDDTTAISTSRALSPPPYGNIGDFEGYDKDISKSSGVGGYTKLYNPSSLSLISESEYISLIDDEEGRPSITST